MGEVQAGVGTGGDGEIRQPEADALESLAQRDGAGGTRRAHDKAGPGEAETDGHHIGRAVEHEAHDGGGAELAIAPLVERGHGLVVEGGVAMPGTQDQVGVQLDGSVRGQPRLRQGVGHDHQRELIGTVGILDLRARHGCHEGGIVDLPGDARGQGRVRREVGALADAGGAGEEAAPDFGGFETQRGGETQAGDNHAAWQDGG
ncbi:MAG: hypothetical protein M5U12_34475 [Verrucomicrobia bacterium]|nr:hypothetical protein [Verrucomicrobiota bacterium]